MTKKEKEIFNWILERSWEKRANPMVIAAALALLFPDGAEDVKKDLDENINRLINMIDKEQGETND